MMVIIQSRDYLRSKKEREDQDIRVDNLKLLDK